MLALKYCGGAREAELAVTAKFSYK